MGEPVLDRALFPVAAQWAYCDHASVGPLPKPTRDELARIYDAQMALGKLGTVPVEATLDAVRADVARAIGASPDEIAFMRATSDGALLIASGLDWTPGDQVVIAADEFGANAYPWLNLRERGVDVVLARAPSERVTPALLDARATPRTRVVAVSQVGFSDGYRNDIASIGRWCRQRGVLFAVDAMQGFGGLPLDVRACSADVAYFGVTKWLLGPHGVSVVYVRDELIERLRPTLAAWRSVLDPMDFLNYDQPLHPSARRFEGGTGNMPGIAGFGVSLKLLTAAGFERIERHVLALTDRLISGARAASIEIKSDLAPSARSGIVLLGLGAANVDELIERTLAARVCVTVRANGVRVSPHGYNTDEDIDRVLKVLVTGGC